MSVSVGSVGVGSHAQAVATRPLFPTLPAWKRGQCVWVMDDCGCGLSLVCVRVNEWGCGCSVVQGRTTVGVVLLVYVGYM